MKDDHKKQNFLSFLTERYYRNQTEWNSQLPENYLLFCIAGCSICCCLLISRIAIRGTAILLTSIGLVAYFVLLIALRKRILSLQERVGVVNLMQLLITPVMTASVCMGTVFLPRTSAGASFLLFIIVFPIFMMNPPIQSLTYVLFWCAVFEALDFFAKEPSVFLTDSVHVLEFGMASLFLCLFVASIRIRLLDDYARARSLSEHHELSGLRNKFALNREAATLTDIPLTVCMMDLDDFKFFNDTYGHDLGDAVIVGFARLLVSVFGEEACYSFGGDEFLVVGKELTAAVAEQKLVQLREKLHQFNIDGHVFHPSFSCGYVFGYADAEHPFFDMVADADRMLYRVKAQQKGTFLGSAFPLKADTGEEDQPRFHAVVNRGTDELTKLPNMMNFRVTAKKLIDNVLDPNRKIVIAYLNISNLKAYNETFGFQKGDELLIEVANSLTVVFKNHLVSRFAEDHFVILTYEETVVDNITTAAKRVRALHEDHPVNIKAGIYRYENKEEIPVDTACDRAKIACDSIRTNISMLYRFYDAELEKKMRIRSYIQTHFERALRNGWIQVYYQTMIRLETGKVAACEALSRWLDPELGELDSSVYIPILEEYHLIRQHDLYIVERVLKEFKPREAIGVVPVSINLSRLDFEDGEMAQTIARMADQYQVSRSNLIVEITETALSVSTGLIQKQIEELHQAGLRVWMDDFGIGYASLTNLQQFDFDLIKLDMYFTHTCLEHEKSATILREIVHLARELGMETMAEGVESGEQQEFLRSIGCDCAQGYFIAHPRPLSYYLEKGKEGKLRSVEEE